MLFSLQDYCRTNNLDFSEEQEADLQSLAVTETGRCSWRECGRFLVVGLCPASPLSVEPSAVAVKFPNLFQDEHVSLMPKEDILQCKHPT